MVVAIVTVMTVKLMTVTSSAISRRQMVSPWYMLRVFSCMIAAAVFTGFFGGDLSDSNYHAAVADILLALVAFRRFMHVLDEFDEEADRRWR